MPATPQIPLMRSRDSALLCTLCDTTFNLVDDELQAVSAAPAAPSPAPTPTPVPISTGISRTIVGGGQAPAEVPAHTTGVEGMSAAELRRYASDVAAKRMGSKLLSGWTMLETVCDVPYCSCPILRSRAGEVQCVVCPDWLPEEQRGPGYSAALDLPIPPQARASPASPAPAAAVGAGALESKTGSPPRQEQHPQQSGDEDWSAALSAVDAGIHADERGGPTARTLGSAPPTTTSRISGVAVMDAPAGWESMTAEEVAAVAGAARPPPPSGAAYTPPQPATAAGTAGVKLMDAPADWMHMTSEQLAAYAASGGSSAVSLPAPAPAAPAPAQPPTPASTRPPAPAPAPTPEPTPSSSTPLTAADIKAQAAAGLSRSIAQATAALSSPAVVADPAQMADLAKCIQQCAEALQVLKA